MARPYYMANVSWGKDSLAMLHLLIENGYPLDEVVYYDTGMEFDAIYKERDDALPMLRFHEITYTELQPKNPMWFDMFARPVKSRETGEVHKHGYGWCGGSCRWGTTFKTQALNKYARSKDAKVYVGIAADESKRVEPNEPFIIHPLVELGITEAECLRFCYEDVGATWEQDGVKLYDILDRVSCWCCRNKNLKELKGIHDHLPRYWNMLCGLENVLGQMKGKPLSEIGGE